MGIGSGSPLVSAIVDVNGNRLVVGGGLQGAAFSGRTPSIAVNPDAGLEVNPLDAGRFMPTIRCDACFAEQAFWLGMTKTQLPATLPSAGHCSSETRNDLPRGILV